jgi:hypothetical protein
MQSIAASIGREHRPDAGDAIMAFLEDPETKGVRKMRSHAWKWRSQCTGLLHDRLRRNGC